MAEKSGRNKSIDELTAEIASSRERVARDLGGLRYELDFAGKFRRSFRKQTGSWLSVAAAVGTLVALAPMRKKKFMSTLRAAANRKRNSWKRALLWGRLNSQRVSCDQWSSIFLRLGLRILQASPDGKASPPF